VLLFSPEGAFVRQVGRLGQGPGEYNGLQTIAVLEDHSLLVANANPCFVNRYDKDLVFRKRQPVPLFIQKIMPCDGFLFVRSSDVFRGGHRVHLMDTQCLRLGSFSPAEDLAVSCGLESSGDLCVVGSHLWLADVYDPTIQVYTGWGQLVKTLGTQHDHDPRFIHSAEVGSLAGVTGIELARKAGSILGRSYTQNILNLQDQLVLVGPYLNPRADADGVNRKNCWDLYDAQGHLLCPMCPWKPGAPCSRRLQAGKDEVYLVDDSSDTLEDAGLSARITRLRLRPDWKAVLAALKG